jgi:hypothetical protein
MITWRVPREVMRCYPIMASPRESVPLNNVHCFLSQGRAVYAAEAERLRLWAEGREKSPVTAAMELVPSGAWVSLFSSSVLCAYVILSSVSGSGTPPGT